MTRVLNPLFDQTAMPKEAKKEILCIKVEPQSTIIDT